VPDGIVDAQAHGLAHIRLGQLETEGPEDLDLRPAPERLGVDQEPVEVEDDRPDGSSAECVGGGEPRAQPSFRTTSTMASPASVGLRATVTPAADRASIFAWAVPLDPEMIAPAWPILRPGGAVTPAT
jgi:hypothetical protein